MSPDTQLKSREEIIGDILESPDFLLLAHHYQRPEIVDLARQCGDSFELARIAATQSHAKHIVLCGVRFMAESVRILALPHQTVYIPEPEAGCPMADMVTIDELSAAHHTIHAASNEAPLPLCYMNTSAQVKAFCGSRGGWVCTSSNAAKALLKALESHRRVLFVPDEYLGRNTANYLGIVGEELAVYDPALPGGGLSHSEINRARLILWKGYCHVHVHFTPAHIQEARRIYPEASVLVHPECLPEVVQLADASGSTSNILSRVKNAPAGQTLIIGTEINFVSRLARDYPDRKILPLSPSLCPNMYNTTFSKLFNTLTQLPQANIVTLPPEVIRDAKLALDRMLELA